MLYAGKASPYDFAYSLPWIILHDVQQYLIGYLYKGACNKLNCKNLIFSTARFLGSTIRFLGSTIKSLSC